MRFSFFALVLFSFGLSTSALAQSGQSPTMQQTTSTTENRQANPPKPNLKKSSPRDRQKQEIGLDTTLPKDRKQRRLRPDSLRRGGATRVDSVRR